MEMNEKRGWPGMLGTIDLMRADDHPVGNPKRKVL
jgi:hypothetical protein